MKSLSKNEAEKIRTNPPPNMSIPEAAAYIGISTTTLWEEMKRRRLRCSRVGRRVIFQKVEVDRYLSALAA